MPGYPPVRRSIVLDPSKQLSSKLVGQATKAVSLGS